MKGKHNRRGQVPRRPLGVMTTTATTPVRHQQNADLCHTYPPQDAKPKYTPPRPATPSALTERHVPRVEEALRFIGSTSALRHAGPRVLEPNYEARPALSCSALVGQSNHLILGALGCSPETCSLLVGHRLNGKLSDADAAKRSRHSSRASGSPSGRVHTPAPLERPRVNTAETG
jgi:hypothetical protein